MFSGQNLADKVLTWEQMHFKINFHKNKGKYLSTVRLWAMHSQNGKLIS